MCDSGCGWNSKKNVESFSSLHWIHTNQRSQYHHWSERNTEPKFERYIKLRENKFD